MAKYLIPTDFGVPAFVMTVEMDTVPYQLSFAINRRDGKWRISMSRAGRQVFTGAVLLTDRDVLAPYRSIADVPPGMLIPRDQTGAGIDPTETGFGTSQILTYETV